MEVLRDRNKALICCFSTAGKVNRFSLAAELGCGPDQRSRHLCLPTRLTVWKLVRVGGRWSEGLKSMTFSVASDVALPQIPNLICHHFLFRFASVLSDCQKDFYFIFFCILGPCDFFWCTVGTVVRTCFPMTYCSVTHLILLVYLLSAPRHSLCRDVIGDMSGYTILDNSGHRAEITILFIHFVHLSPKGNVTKM